MGVEPQPSPRQEKLSKKKKEQSLGNSGREKKKDSAKTGKAANSGRRSVLGKPNKPTKGGAAPG